VAEKKASKKPTALQRLTAQQRAQRKAQAEALKAKRQREKEREKARLAQLKAQDRARLKAERERIKRIERSRRERDRQAVKRLRERQRQAKEALKEAQHLLARARKALSKSQRKKLKPIRELSPKTIAKEARQIKEKGAKLAPEKSKRRILERITKSNPELNPPKKGYITTKCFDSDDIHGILDYIHAIWEYYINTGGNGKSPVYRFLIRYFHEDGKIQSTILYEPQFFTVKDLIEAYDRVQSVPGSNRYDEDNDEVEGKLEEICVVISWSRDFLKTRKGWTA
jgi:hypothetical protein